ncbi:MqnA/MqnD/SBP family protein [Helicobacter cappadocius]|uniref:Chorismate dehydratase n=1 Tax=Helicobacter cappadocius TaxID=3063998 RepID=A0AA90T4V3_9HELI|nr:MULTISPECIES: MqnA/MqnD/SBP family protein [unclassified Helicobacter]MDO7253111.1 MqnA/MqnD/SBP family protein [Helicobacter sp. faydin-H75]MDP2538763.1 MqnA/MqnD/SBP family protein [Helicobacter sp. faydin-H76]
MRFGKIDYLNLAPFDVFIKSYPTTSSFKKFLQSHKSYPARLNKDFLFKRIDAGFISSIAGYQSSLKNKVTTSGIIAKGSVWSVIVMPTSQSEDYQSATSNALCKVLDLKGEVLIGDRALLYRYNGGEHIDMGERWYQKKHLPFVFGRFCYNTHGDFYKNLSKHFNQKKTKIPYYILNEYSQKTSIPKKYILEYLKHIYYKIGPKERLGLKRFYRELLFKKIKKPSRF